jgi:phospholipid/cholesterol/gamma-HCH transport system substrate-binding protein
MEREANYVAVGAFVLLLLAMAVGFVLWYSDTGDRRSYQRYEIYFDGSVFGLSEGGSVRYLGVAVGRVVRIGVDPRNSGRVRVVADIYEDTPITDSTVARLALQGVTGLLFVDLKPADPGKPPEEIPPDTQFPVIPSERSDFDVFVSSLPDAVAKASEVLNRMTAVLSDQNIQTVTETLDNAKAATDGLPGAVAEARQLLARLDAAATDVRGVANDLRQVTSASAPEINAAIKELRAAAGSMAAASEGLDQLVAANQGSINRFAGEGLAEIEQLVRDMRETSQTIEKLGRRLEEDPSRLLYQPSTRGVEIPK